MVPVVKAEEGSGWGADDHSHERRLERVEQALSELKLDIKYFGEKLDRYLKSNLQLIGRSEVLIKIFLDKL